MSNYELPTTEKLTMNKMDLKKSMINQIVKDLNAYHTDIVHDFDKIDNMKNIQIIVFATRKTGTSIIDNEHFDKMNNLGNDQFWRIQKIGKDAYTVRPAIFQEIREIMRSN